MRLTAGRSADAELTAERTNQLSVLLSASVMGRQCSPSFQLNGLAMRAENLRGREADSTRDLRGFCVRNTPRWCVSTDVLWAALTPARVGVSGPAQSPS